jgi:outer membrane cobalamin receptor
MDKIDASAPHLRHPASMVTAVAAAALLLGGLPPPASAQEPVQGAPPPAEPATDLSEVTDFSLDALLNPAITTASRVLERATDAPATVYVITRQDIRARGYSMLLDVLRDLPGMETIEQYYSEQGTLVPVRGVVGNNKIVILVNGMRVNPPGGEETMIRSDMSVRFAEQIEVIYGPGSTLYGQDAISAVINIKTQSPGAHTVELLGGYGLHQTIDGFASFATTVGANLDSPISVTGFASLRTSDLSNFRKEYPEWWQKFQDALAPMMRSVEPERGDFGLNALARIQSKNASLQAWYRESERSSAEGSGEGGRTPVLFFVDEARWRDRSLVVEGQHTLLLSSSVRLSSILTFNRYEVAPKSRYVFPDGAGGLFLQDFKYGIGTSASVEEKLDWDLSEATRFMFGVVATSYDIIPKATVLGGANPDGDIISQAGRLAYYTEANNPASRVEIPRTVNLQYQQYGAYAEGVHAFNESLRAVAGVRVDVNSRYGEVPLSPRAALLFNTLDRRLTLKYIFSMAYVAPAPYFAYNVFDNGVQISSGNPDLKPERAMSNEVNATWQDEGLLVSASGYYNRQSDLLITAQSEAPETVVSPMVFVNPDGTGARRLTRSINLGTSHALGGDLFARYRRASLSFWASYSLVSFSRTIGAVESGLQQISTHNVRAGVTWTVIPSLMVTPSLVLRSTPANLPPGYTELGASLSTPYEVNLSVVYTPLQNLDAFVLVRNATFHHYALRGVSGPALQEPFSALFGARFRY